MQGVAVRRRVLLGVRPAPGARTRSDGSIPASTARAPLCTVDKDKPDAPATALTPPWPNARAAAPPTIRRPRSFR